ncbi:hypothetical protein PPACK8108_LOCUS14704, partial [Phakopsora pachyrhizi]
TFVNFTMTWASLQIQSSSQVLQVESPESDKIRTEAMKCQGEFKLILSHLKKYLLKLL